MSCKWYEVTLDQLATNRTHEVLAKLATDRQPNGPSEEQWKSMINAISVGDTHRPFELKTFKWKVIWSEFQLLISVKLKISSSLYRFKQN